MPPPHPHIDPLANQLMGYTIINLPDGLLPSVICATEESLCEKLDRSNVLMANQSYGLVSRNIHFLYFPYLCVVEEI